MDGSKFGLGQRGSRWSAVVNDGVVEQLNVEEPGAFGLQRDRSGSASACAKVESGLAPKLWARPDVDIDGLLRLGRSRRIVGATLVPRKSTAALNASA